MPVKRRLLKPDAEFAQQPVVASSPRLLTIPKCLRIYRAPFGPYGPDLEEGDSTYQIGTIPAG